MHNEEHYFTSGNVTILDKEDDWHIQGIREAIQIKALRPSLNRDQGRAQLPGCYDGIISELIAPGSRRRVEASKGRQGPSWPQTQQANWSGDRGNDDPHDDASQTGATTSPGMQTGNPTQLHPNPANSQTDPKDPRGDVDTCQTLPKRGRGRPRGSANSDARQIPGRPSIHNMMTRRGGQ